MNRIGSGDNGEWTFIDLLSIVSFIVGLQNLDLNLTQENLDNQTVELKAQVDKEVQKALEDIHKHLEMQDEKLNTLLNLFGEGDNNDSR